MRYLKTFLLLLGALGALARICVVPELDSQLVERLGQRLLPWMDQLAPEHLNPSIFVGLRLSGMQAGTKEDLYLHSLKLSYQKCLLGSASSDDGGGDCRATPSMGQLALYLLALRANCEFVGGRKGDRLVSQLKRFLEDEKKAIGHDHKGQPHTSYYQYGLSILALCLHQKRVHDHVVGKLLHAVEHDHLHQGHGSVDTVAMAGLAFICLERSNFNPDLEQRISTAITAAREKILKAQTPEGYFGNVYSTPLALQLLTASPGPHGMLGTACLQARAALLTGLQGGTFQNALTISQLLPVLNHKTYLDLTFPDCQAQRVMLAPALEVPALLHVPETISVTLKVSSVLPPYKQAIAVPAGSSLENVLNTAQELGGFTYETQASLSGPYLTSVLGKVVGDREFWQLLRDPDTPLLQGIADYTPQDGEVIKLRLVRW